MNTIIKLLEKILGQRIAPELQAELYKIKVEHEAQMLQQMNLSQQRAFLAPRAAGKSSAIQALQQMQGTVQHLAPGQAPPQFVGPAGATFEEYYRRAMGMAPPEPEPADTVMEFSLED